MKEIFKNIALVLFLIIGQNGYAQLIPVPGSRQTPVNVPLSGQIAFGWNKPGISAFYINAGESGAYSPVDVMQITNNGNFCFRGMRESQDTFLHLLRGDVTYAKWTTAGYNSNLIAKNSIKFITNNIHEVATFYTNKISFYENTEVEKDDITVALGLNDNKDAGWIGTKSQSGCHFGAGAHNNMYMDVNYGVYIGGITGAEVASYRTELKNKYKLFVKKGVLAEDFAIAPTSSWADFVFGADYNLRPLTEVERFIEENKHLPEVPSAAKVAEEGYSQHDMNKVLLQKIEELTLYTIQQQKEIEELRTQLKQAK